LEDLPAGGLVPQLVAYPELLAHALTFGGLCPHAWVDNPAAGQVSEIALHVRLLPSWLAGSVCGAWFARRALIPHAMTRHISGPRLLEGREAEQAALREASKARGGRRAPGFVRLHRLLDLPKRVWCRHVLIYGSVGSGKTQIIFPIVQQAIAKKKKIFLVDVKGDYTPAILHALILSPWDRRSVYWDIAADVRTSAQAATFASSLIPSEEGSNRFFSTAAEMILTGCLRALQRHGGASWTWVDLNDLLSMSAEELSGMLAQHYAKAKPLLEGAEVTSGSILSTLAAYTQTITQLAEAFGDGTDEQGKPRKRLSLVNWCQDGYTGRTTIIAQAGPDPGLTQRYLAAAINVMVPEILRLPDDVSDEGRAIFMVLDELAAIGRVNLAPLVDKGRSKSVAVVMGVQDMANQVGAVHGEHFGRALPGMVGTHILTQVQIGPTRSVLAEAMGKRRVALTTLNTGMNAGQTVSEEWRPLVQPTDLTALLGRQTGPRSPEGDTVRAIAALGGDLLVLDWPVLPLPKLRRSFVPARWTLPQDVVALRSANEDFVYDQAKRQVLTHMVAETRAEVEAALASLPDATPTGKAAA
jgi:hypothetical protein